MEKRVAIVGAALSGLLACKYVLHKGFQAIVFEANERIGGVWGHSVESTNLQTMKQAYQFSDFPWPSSVKELYPSHTEVLEYLESYAHHFGIYRCIKFNSKVTSIDYCGETYEEIESWHYWGGNGIPFRSKGKWYITVQDVKSCNVEVYQTEFVILCIGLFSGLPNIPEFPPNQGPEVFNGKVIHSMDYGAMDGASAEEFVKNKRVTIVGSRKSAADTAAYCANINGPKYPCTMIQRTAHWFLPRDYYKGILGRAILCFKRLSRFVHKPGETLMLGLLATLLSPLRWGTSKFVECYLKWKLPLKKYGMIPKYSFLHGAFSCLLALLPESFFSKVEEGSIVIKNSPSFSFFREGLIVDGETKPMKTDIVIYATGFKGEEKLRNIFASPIFQQYMMGSNSTSIHTLYRQVIHPRIPQLVIIGFAESASSLTALEIRCEWLAHILEGNIKLPCIREMEKEVKMWENYINRNSTKYVRRSCIDVVHVDGQLCKELGRNNV